jgi:hypothetical protein
MGTRRARDHPQEIGIYIVLCQRTVLYGIGYHQVQCSAQVFFDRSHSHTAALLTEAGLKYTQ